MYEHHHTVAAVREPQPTYGAGPGKEAYPAESILRDLTRTRDARTASRVLARFAVARFCLLRPDRADAALVEHARTAARAHLEAADAEWREGEILRRVLARPEPPGRSGAWLAAAAAEAEGAGHVHGALGLRRTAFSIAHRRLDLARAAEHASGLAELCRRMGANGEALRWREKAARLAREAPLYAPPSLS